MVFINCISGDSLCGGLDLPQVASSFGGLMTEPVRMDRNVLTASNLLPFNKCSNQQINPRWTWLWGAYWALASAWKGYFNRLPTFSTGSASIIQHVPKLNAKIKFWFAMVPSEITGIFLAASKSGSCGWDFARHYSRICTECNVCQLGDIFR